MRIIDFESGKSLNDVCITLSREEAEELCVYLTRLTTDPGAVRHVHLTELRGTSLERELAVALAA